MKKVILATVFAALAGSVSAATLDFNGNICNSGNACSNRDAIDQTYGDIAGEIDVQYDANRSTTDMENLLYWGPDYETLTGVAYGLQDAGGLSISLMAERGFDIMLSAFDIAPYDNRIRNTLVQIIDLATNTILVDDVYTPLSTAGVTSYSGDWVSTVGLQINLGPDAWDVGIDNIQYNSLVEDMIPVPLPAGGLLLLSGLLGLAAAKRNRS